MAIKQHKPVEAFEILKNNPGAMYLDVRTEPEFTQGHPAGSINVPVVFFRGPGQMVPNEDFLAVVERNVPKNTKLVVGCQMGGRSQRACEILEQAGYTDLTNIVGGFGGQRNAAGEIVVQGWRDEGLPVACGAGDACYQSLRKKAGL